MRSNRRLRMAAIPLAVVTTLVLAACTPQQTLGWLPTEPGTTNQVDRVIGLWTTSWIVLLVVGAITWGLIIWAAIVYRRRKGQTGLPVQLRYNMPIEILYTVIPLILVIGFFAFTARDQAAIEEPIADPDVQIEVYGKRWAWDFNYITEDVYYQGIQAQEGEEGITFDTLPTLYLPVGQTVEIKIESRDVLHSFWIVDFLYKKDMVPARSNYWYFEPLKEGSYQGKCAELCGEYHSLMLFNVEVVSVEEYEAYTESLRDAGNEGRLGEEFNTNQNLPGTTGASEEE
ncbi:aa3-type cytochrome oxidase subunit II [Microcella daejeonensis]